MEHYMEYPKFEEEDDYIDYKVPLILRFFKLKSKKY